MGRLVTRRLFYREFVIRGRGRFLLSGGLKHRGIPYVGRLLISGGFVTLGDSLHRLSLYGQDEVIYREICYTGRFVISS